MNRREFLTAAGGSAAATTAVAAGSAAAQEGEGGASVQPDWGGYLDGANAGTFTDARGQSEVTVQVGSGGQGLAFDPTGLWVDTGTTVIWEWTGQGGGHNVISQEGPASLDSGDAVSEAGTTFEHTFGEGEAGITTYYCQPHQSLGMLGAVAVGDDVATVEVGGGGEKELEELGVPIQAHWVGSATILGIIVTIVYTFYILKYGESPNTGTGRNG